MQQCLQNRGMSELQLQWTPSNLATLGTSQSVLIILISEVNSHYKPRFGTFFQSGLNTGVATFQGSRLEGVHCV